MALIGEMQYLTIGGNTYSIPTSGGSTVTIERALTSGTKSATISVDGTSYDLYAPTPNAGTVTSVRVQATSPVQSSTSTAQSSTLNTTISLANGYGDTKNPYSTKTANYVLAGPTSGSAAAPSFRALVAADIPDLSGTYLTSHLTGSGAISVENGQIKLIAKTAMTGGTEEYISSITNHTIKGISGFLVFCDNGSGDGMMKFFPDMEGVSTASQQIINSIPTKVSQLTNDSGFITDYTETDPTVPSWAKASTKPTYTASEVGAYTTSEVDALIEGLPEPMIFKGSLGTGGTITSLPTAAASNEGHTYKVITAGTYASQSAKVGDTFISDGSAWVLIPSGDEPSGTVTSVTLTQGTGITISNSGTAITTSGSRTISLASITKSDTTSTASPSHGGTFTAIDSITYDTYGRVTGVNTKTVTLPADSNTDTKVTQAYSTTNSNYPVLFSATAGVSSTSSRGATTAILNNAIYANPSTGNLHVTQLNGVAVGTSPKFTDTTYTNVSEFTNDAGYITSADIPEGASAYTGTISAVGTSASTGTNNGFARGDHVHNITKTTINSVLGTGSGTTKFYREDGTWATPAYIANTDEKLAVAQVSTNGTYYPIFGTGTAASTRQYDTTGFSYYEYNGTTSVTGSSRIILGNNTPAQTAGNKIGSIQIYGGTAYSYTIAASTLGPLANRTITLPDNSGTIALTSDIPDVSSFITDAGVTKITTTAGTHSAITNATGAVSFNVPTKTSHLTNDSNFVTSSGVTSITLKAGSGISLDTNNTAITTTGTRTISHADTSSQASSSNSGRTYIQSLTLDDYGHVTGISTATETVTDTNTWRTIQVNGTDALGSGTGTGKLNLKAGTGITVTNNSGTVTIASTITDTDTHRSIQMNGIEILGNNTTALNLKAGTNVSLSNSSGTVTITATDTKYTAASANPLMDGTVAVGTSEKYAREDHVHPSDTSRVPTTRTINGKALSGNITLNASDIGISDFTAATASASGTHGLVPAPEAGTDLYFKVLTAKGVFGKLALDTATHDGKLYMRLKNNLDGDSIVNMLTAEIPTATTSNNGLISASDKTKLNSVTQVQIVRW